MNNITNLTLSGATRFFLYLLVFFQPFNHFNSFREIGFYGLLMLFIIRLFKERPHIPDLKDSTIAAILLLFIWSVMVSLTGPFPSDSMHALSKNLFQQILIFFVIITEFNGMDELKKLFRIVVASFAAVTLASVIENAVIDPQAFFMLIPSVAWREASEYFFSGYANKTTFYLPFIAAWLMSIREAGWKRWAGALTLCLGLLMVYIYNSRAAFLIVPTAVTLIFFLSKRYRLTAACLLIALLFAFLIMTSESERFSRYRTLSQASTYVSDNGLSGRKGLWLVTFNLIKKRPLTGYGYGWKKMAWAVKDSGLIEPLKEEYPSAYDYFTNQAHMSYGKVNPHNLFLQIAFEIGLVGLGIFLWLWFTVIAKMFKSIGAAANPESAKFMLLSLGLVLSYIGINLSNGYWQESYGNMIFLFIASIVVLNRELLNKRHIG